MKGVVFVAVIAALAVVALGHRDGSSGEEEARFYGPCACSTTNRRGRATPNPCANNTGATNICGAGQQYLTCKDEACSIANCSATQLWNKTQKACVSCKDGFHVAADFSKCVCNIGTIFNRTSRACVACPKSATELADRCFCNTTGATPFLSKKEWACKACPGQYVSYNVTNWDWNSWTHTVETVQVCQCPGANDVFNVRSVSCVTCPANSKAMKARSPMGQDSCSCITRGQYYNETTNACSCFPFLVLNAAGTSCEWPSRTMTVAPTTKKVAAP